MLSVGRRTAFASPPAAALLGGVGAQAASAPSAEGPIRLAFLTDGHADPENEAHMTPLQTVFTAIDDFDPRLVIHGGDVTEHGTVTECEAFEESIPAGLRDRVTRTTSSRNS